jgi:hypothetical protein
MVIIHCGVPEIALSPKLNLNGKELSERCKMLGVV